MVRKCKWQGVNIKGTSSCGGHNTASSAVWQLRMQYRLCSCHYIHLNHTERGERKCRPEYGVEIWNHMRIHTALPMLHMNLPQCRWCGYRAAWGFPFALKYSNTNQTTQIPGYSNTFRRSPAGSTTVAKSLGGGWFVMGNAGRYTYQTIYVYGLAY